MTTATLVQVEFRARNDDVALNSGTFTYALNANFTQDVDVPFRVRFTIAETTGGMANNIAYSLQYNLDGAGFVAIGDTAAVKSALSVQFANADPTTQVISTGSFVAGAGYEQTTTSNISLVSQRTEIEWCLSIDSAQVTNGQTFTLRVVQAAGAVLQTYTQTPTITVSEAVSIPFTANTLTGIVALSGIAPTVSADASVTAILAPLAISGVAPTWTEDYTAASLLGSLALSGDAPSVSADASLTSILAGLQIAGLAPSSAATADVTTILAELRLLGIAPTVDTGAHGLIEILTANTILASTNLQDSGLTSPPELLTDLDDNPDGSPGPDSLWWTAVDVGSVTDVRLGFPTSSGHLIGTQQIRVLVRGSSLPCRDVTVELWQAGSKLTSEVTESVTSIDGQVIVLEFEPGELSGSPETGADVEVRIFAAA